MSSYDKKCYKEKNMDMKNKKFLCYVSYTKGNEEILDEYQLLAESISDGKNKAMEKMAKDGGTNRKIDGIHLMDEEFKRREASFSSDGGRVRTGHADKT